MVLASGLSDAVNVYAGLVTSVYLQEVIKTKRQILLKNKLALECPGQDRSADPAIRC